MIPLKWWLESTQRKVNREIRWLCRLEQMGTNWFSWKIRCTKGQPERNFVQPKTYYLNIMPPLASLTHSDFSFPKARIFSTPQTWDQKHPLSFGDSSPAPEAKGSVSHKSDQISDWESDIGGKSPCKELGPSLCDSGGERAPSAPAALSLKMLGVE